MIITVEQGPPKFTDNSWGMVIYNVETDSKEAWKEADIWVRGELKSIGIKLPKNLMILNDKANGAIQDAIYDFVETYQGNYPRTALLTGWWDIYDGNPCPFLTAAMQVSIKKSKSLQDLIQSINGKYGFIANLTYDQYGGDADHFMRRAIENIKSGKFK